jgi:reverse gyrase
MISGFWVSFHLGRNLALQFAPAGLQSGGFQSVSERWIVIQREQKRKAIQVCAETMPQFSF